MYMCVCAILVRINAIPQNMFYGNDMVLHVHVSTCRILIGAHVLCTISACTHVYIQIPMATLNLIEYTLWIQQ